MATEALILVFMVIVLTPAFLVGRDAQRHGQPGGVWALVTFFTFPLGLVAWLVVRALLSRPTV